MGGTSKQTQTQFSKSNATTAPWESTQDSLAGLIGSINGLLGPAGQPTAVENSAIGGLLSNAQAGNTFAPQIAELAKSMLGGTVSPDRTGMVTDGFNAFKGGMTPFTTASTNPWENADFRATADNISGKAIDAVKSSIGGAGISAANFGDFGKRVGEGVGNALAPVAWNASNDLNTRKLGAINSLFTGGNTAAGLLGNLDQATIGNRVAGVGIADAATTAQNQPFMKMLEAEALKRGIPLQNLNALANLIIPMARLGGTTTQEGSGQTQGVNQMSGAQQFGLIAQGIGNLMPKSPISIGA